MELHAHVPTPGNHWVHWLLEGIFIVVSVMLGFGVAQYREARQDRELATRVLKGLEAEVEYNLAAVEPFVGIHDKWLQGMAKYESTDKSTETKFPACPNWSDACGVFFGSRPVLGELKTTVPVLHRAAWDVALSTSALKLIDYDLAAQLSETYQTQDLLTGNVARLSSSLNAISALEPATRAPAVRQLGLVLVEVAYDERQLLIPQYKKILPSVRAAAARAER